MRETKFRCRILYTLFPYFQVAQVLYAKQLYDNNDTEVASRVKLASAYAPNRNAMYTAFQKSQAEKFQEIVKPVRNL